MQKISTFVLNKVVRWHEWGEMEMFIKHVILAIFASTYAKWLKLMEIWRSSDRKNFTVFLRHEVYSLHDNAG